MMIPKFRDQHDVPSSWIIDYPNKSRDNILSDAHQLDWEFQLLEIKQGPSTREHAMDEFRRNGTADTPYFPPEKDAITWASPYIEIQAEKTLSSRKNSTPEILSSNNIEHKSSVVHDFPKYRNSSSSAPKPPAEYYMRELNKAKNNESCRLCKSNGELPSVYLSHKLKDELGLVTCPVLQQYTCELCGASGPLAHTLKYCPYATHAERQQCTAILRSVRSNSSRRRRYNSDPQRDLAGGARRLHKHQSQ